MKLSSPSQGDQATSVASASFPLQGPNGSASAPTYSFSGAPSHGMYYDSTFGGPSFSNAGTRIMHVGASGVYAVGTAFVLTDSSGSNAAFIQRDAVAIVALRNGTEAQTLRVYGTTTGSKYVTMLHDGTDGYVQAATGSGRLIMGTVAASDVVWIRGNAAVMSFTATGLMMGADNSYDIGTSDATRPKALFLSAPSITKGSGTGFTLNDSGSVRTVIYKGTTTFSAFAAAAGTGDFTICTLPAKTRVIAAYADTTTKYIGGAVSAATLRLGISAGGVEVIASHDVFTAAVTKGLADADMGTSMTRAAQIQGAYTPSFTTTTTLIARMTTTSANTNALTQGSTTWYIVTEVLP